MSIVVPGGSTGSASAHLPDPAVGWQLRRATMADVEAVAGWSRSTKEAQRWATLPQHPFPRGAIAGWWLDPDVTPWLLVDPDGVSVAYGEIWDDAEEDEVELARLIVAPRRRRQGVGRLLVQLLLPEAGRTSRANCFLRVAPDNTPALALYRACGFLEVAPALTDVWNQHQPVAYVWLQHPLRAD